jgi:Cyclin, N-terminal domain
MSSAGADDEKPNISAFLRDDVSLRPPMPSRTADGHDAATRSMVCRMFVASETLRLDEETRFTAVVLWHRYFAAVESSKVLGMAGAATANTTSDEVHNNDGMAWEAAACLFLACKVEDKPRQLRDIINVARMVLKEQPESTAPSSEKYRIDLLASASLAENNASTQNEPKLPVGAPKRALPLNRDPPPLNEAYWDTKLLLVRSEQIVLRWLGFDVMVSKPHRAVTMVLEEPAVKQRLLVTLTQGALDQLSNVAWRRLNDALFHSLALQHSVMELACAAIVLAVEEVGSTTMPSPDPEEQGKGCTINLAVDEVTSASCSHWWNLVEVSDAALAKTKHDLMSATNESLQLKSSIRAFKKQKSENSGNSSV